MRNELKRLESDAGIKTKEGEAVKIRIGQLEESIAAYEQEYAQLIAQAEHIKSNLVSVQEKVRVYLKFLLIFLRLDDLPNCLALYDLKEIVGLQVVKDLSIIWTLLLAMLYLLDLSWLMLAILINSYVMYFSIVGLMRSKPHLSSTVMS